MGGTSLQIECLATADFDVKSFKASGSVTRASYFTTVGVCASESSYNITKLLTWPILEDVTYTGTRWR